MKGYLAFSLLLDIGLLLWRIEGPPESFPELVASWDANSRFSPSLPSLETSTFPGLFWFIHSETSSDDACRAVNPLIWMIIGNVKGTNIHADEKGGTWERRKFHLSSRRVLENTYWGSILSLFVKLASKKGSQSRSITALRFTNMPELAQDNASTCKHKILEWGQSRKTQNPKNKTTIRTKQRKKVQVQMKYPPQSQQMHIYGSVSHFSAL